MITIAAIQAEVARAFRIPVEKMSEPRWLGRTWRNTYEFSHPRQAAMYLAVNLTHHSVKRIGYYFGRRDHTTVLWTIRAVEKRMAKDKDLSQKLLGIAERLKSSAIPKLSTGQLSGSAFVPCSAQGIISA